MMYGMKKTTVYLPDELKQGVSRAADASGLSEADVIRKGIQSAVDRYTAPPLRAPLFDSGDPGLWRGADDNELLEGFGED